MTGIPCVHAIRAIYCQGLNPEDFTHPCYKVSTCKTAYDSCIMPMNGRSEWTPTGIIPPLYPKTVRSIGRPPNARRREPDELPPKRKMTAKPIINRFRVKRQQKTIKCSKCGLTGHNKKLCCNLIPLANEVKQYF
ncbi:hypothetical protein ACS0TY_011519 [Phlomoides rotata]